MSLVAELMVENGVQKPLIRIGWPDQFVERCQFRGELREKYGLTAKAVVEQVRGTPSPAVGGEELSVNLLWRNAQKRDNLQNKKGPGLCIEIYRFAYRRLSDRRLRNCCTNTLYSCGVRLWED